VIKSWLRRKRNDDYREIFGCTDKEMTAANKNLVASGEALTAVDKKMVTTSESFIAAFKDLANDHAAIKKILSKLNLAQEDETISIKALTGGVSSNIFLITSEQAQYCLKQALPQLKVAKQWLAPVNRVFAEIDWLQTAAQIAPKAVPKILGIDQASKSFVMQYLGGEYLNWKAELLAGRVTATVAAQLGNILGRIHSQTALNDELAKRFANDDTFYAIRLEPYLEEAARQHPALSPRLKALIARTQHNPKVLVHGDVSPKNILLGPEGPVVLDAECAWYGDPAFDVAFCLNHFFLKAAHLPGSIVELMQSAQDFLNAYLQEVNWEPVPELEHRISTLLPGLMLARIDGKSPVEYLAAERGATVRKIAIEFLMQDDISFSMIHTRWRQAFAK
jgi:5-methylthioribose kinase